MDARRLDSALGLAGLLRFYERPAGAAGWTLALEAENIVLNTFYLDLFTAMATGIWLAQSPGYSSSPVASTFPYMSSLALGFGVPPGTIPRTDLNLIQEWGGNGSTVAWTTAVLNGAVTAVPCTPLDRTLTAGTALVVGGVAVTTSGAGNVVGAVSIAISSATFTALAAGAAAVYSSQAANTITTSSGPLTGSISAVPIAPVLPMPLTVTQTISLAGQSFAVATNAPGVASIALSSSQPVTGTIPASTPVVYANAVHAPQRLPLTLFAIGTSDPVSVTLSYFLPAAANAVAVSFQEAGLLYGFPSSVSGAAGKFASHATFLYTKPTNTDLRLDYSITRVTT